MVSTALNSNAINVTAELCEAVAGVADLAVDPRKRDEFIIDERPHTFSTPVVLPKLGRWCDLGRWVTC